MQDREAALLISAPPESAAQVAACTNDWKLLDFCPELWPPSPTSSDLVAANALELRNLPIRSLRCFSGQSPREPVTVTYPTDTDSGTMLLEPLCQARSGLKLELMNASTDRFRSSQVKAYVVYDLDKLAYDEKASLDSNWAPSFARTLAKGEVRQDEKGFDASVEALLVEHGESSLEEAENEAENNSSEGGGADPDEVQGDAEDEGNEHELKAPQAFSVKITKTKLSSKRKTAPTGPVKVIGEDDEDEDILGQDQEEEPVSSVRLQSCASSADTSPMPMVRKLALKKGVAPPKSIFSQLYSLPPETKIDIPILEFESRFESGNLHRAICVSPIEYDLVLSSDTNSTGHMQWFYFGVRNMIANVRYKFNIINLEKNNSVFNLGMRPCMFSNKHSENTGLGWFRAVSAEDISYFHNYHRRPHKADMTKLPKEESETKEPKKKVVRKSGKKGGKKKGAKRKTVKGGKKKGGFGAASDDCYYTLTFTVQFPYGNDTAYLAHFYPFTASYLNRFLEQIEDTPSQSCFMQRQKLCLTRGGNVVQLLTITNFGNQKSEEGFVEMKARKLVVYSARVHPGENNASWVLKGVIQFLVGNSPEAQTLRNNVVFKIIPMLNPDGVIEGNGRCSLEGIDLNRMWNSPSPVLHPSIFHAKRLIRHLARDRNLMLYCDFHGHSKIKNMVLYGCGIQDCDSSCVPALPAAAMPPRLDVTNAEDEIKGDTALCNPPTPNATPAFTEPPNATHEQSNMLAIEPHKEKVFPWLLADRAPHLFSLQKSTFGVKKSKAGSARVAVFRDTGITSSYTMEASFCGADIGNMDAVHFNTSHYEEMGTCFGKATFDMWETTSSSLFPQADLLEKVQDYKSHNPVLDRVDPLLIGGIAPGVSYSEDARNYTLLDDLPRLLSESSVVAEEVTKPFAQEPVSVQRATKKKSNAALGEPVRNVVKATFNSATMTSKRRNSLTDVVSPQILRRVRATSNRRHTAQNSREADAQRRAAVPSIVSMSNSNKTRTQFNRVRGPSPREEEQQQLATHRVGLLGNLARGRPVSFNNNKYSKEATIIGRKDRKVSRRQTDNSGRVASASSLHFGYFADSSNTASSLKAEVRSSLMPLRRSRSNSGPTLEQLQQIPRPTNSHKPK